MKPTPLLATLVLVASCSAALAQQEDPPLRITIHPRKITEPELEYRLLPAATDLRPGDAAQVYLLAFGQRVEGLGFPDFNQMVESTGNDFPIDQARDFVDRYDASTALGYLKLAAHRSSCTWDLTDREQGVSSRALSYLDRSAQWYGGLISLQARVAIVDGHFEQAIASLQTGFAMSRNLAHGAPLSQSMDALYVNSLMCADVLRWAQGQGSPNLYWPLRNLPSRYAALPAAIENEAAMLERSFPGIDRAEKLGADESRDILRRMGAQVGRRDEFQTILEMMRDYPAVKRRVVESGLLTSQTAERLPANSLMLVWYYHEYRRTLDSLSKYLSLPPWQAGPAVREAFDAGMNRDHPSNPLIAMLPHFPDVVMRFALSDRRVAMLASLEALRNYAATHQSSLPESLEQLSPQTPSPLDPLTGQPFAYQKTREGATLSASAPEFARNNTARTWTITLAP